MNTKPSRLAIILASTLIYGTAHADQHTTKALEQASEAASSAGDSKAVAEHATEALKHIDAAKKEATSADMARHLIESEKNLNSALKNAEQYNSGTAAQQAQEAKTHLDAATHK